MNRSAIDEFSGLNLLATDPAREESLALTSIFTRSQINNPSDPDEPYSGRLDPSWWETPVVPAQTDPPNKPKAQPKPRSPAQQAAARKNGAKSKGPKTQEGKKRSSANSLKHGLLARPQNACWEKSPDSVLRAELVQAFKASIHPANQLDQSLLELAALDLVRIRRAISMEESILDPAIDQFRIFRNKEDLETKVRRHNEIGVLLKKMIERVQDGKAFAIPTGDASRLVSMIQEKAKQDLANIKEFMSDPEGRTWYDDEFTAERLQSIYAQFGPESRDLLDPVRLFHQLALARSLTEEARIAWMEFLPYLQCSWRYRAGSFNPIWVEEAEELDQNRRRQASKLPDLEQVLRYETRYRNHLNKTLRLLMNLQDDKV